VCGRYKLSRRKQLVEEYFDCGSDEPDWNPRYYMAPTQPVAVVRQNPKEPVRELSLMRWTCTLYRLLKVKGKFVISKIGSIAQLSTICG
jgi:putative SOS response-associated peptidase YedK